MTNQGEDTRAPSERVHDTERMLTELQAAVREAVARHKGLGNPIAIWRDGRVVSLSPDESPDA